MTRKKKVNWGPIFAIFIIVLMFSSTIGFLVGPFSFSGSSLAQDSITVNGHKLTLTPTGGYEGTFNGARVAFTYSPLDANRTNIPSSFISSIKTSRFAYLTSDPNSTFAGDIAGTQYQLSQILLNEFTIQTQLAFNESFGSLPVIDCMNATTYTPVIKFEDGNATGTALRGTCLVLTAASPSAYLEMRDRLLYGLFGVLQ